MTLLQAAILGLIQGLTEFLPISSSGHLVIVQNLFRFSDAPVSFDIFLHLATLAAVIVFFRQTIIRLNRRLILLLLVSTIPSVIVALLAKSFLDYFFSSIILLSLGFFITALFIFLSDRLPESKGSLKNVNTKISVYIGIFQAIAIAPSISRSGATIYAGLKSGLNRDSAVKFAFIMSIPAILGAVAFEAMSLDSSTSVGLFPTLVGMITAFIVGFYSLRWLQKLVLNSRLAPFGWYSLFVGIVTLIWGVSTYII